MYIPRVRLEKRIVRALKNNPGVIILGPRQCGKTTIARKICKDIGAFEFFDLENPLDAVRLENPLLTLENLNGLVVIDEIQRRPELFEVLRVLMDRPNTNTTYLILGSASPDLVKKASETLAGRVGFVDMSGFSLDELESRDFQKLWYRGGFPRSFLAPDDEVSYSWRMDFIRTFLERDIPQLGISIPSQTLRRFWTMLAHYSGQRWNATEFARSLDTSQKTAKRYLDILTDTFVVRQLQPWYENIKKRQVKAPKIYIRDSGILHALLGISNAKSLYYHPKLGASWEGFVIEQIASLCQYEQLYFWQTHGGAELDLLLVKNGRKIGVEIKYTEKPRITKTISISINDLDLEKLYIVYPGDKSFTLSKKVEVLSILNLNQIFES